MASADRSSPTGRRPHGEIVLRSLSLRMAIVVVAALSVPGVVVVADRVQDQRPSDHRVWMATPTPVPTATPTPRPTPTPGPVFGPVPTPPPTPGPTLRPFPIATPTPTLPPLVLPTTTPTPTVTDVRGPAG